MTSKEDKTEIEALIHAQEAFAEQAAELLKQANKLSVHVAHLKKENGIVENKSNDDGEEIYPRTLNVRDNYEGKNDRANLSERVRLIEQHMDNKDEEDTLLDRDNKFLLSESTFSLFITERPCST